jgi:uncharacterized OB-fold protein
MTGVVRTYTIIHAAPQELAPIPYAVVVADESDGTRLAARADGDLSWLRVGASVSLLADERFGMRCERSRENSAPSSSAGRHRTASTG